MSTELHTLMKAAAPTPRLGVDQGELQRRARRVTWERVAVVAAMLVVIASGLYLAATIGADEPIPPAGDRSRAEYLPFEDRHLVLSGTYGRDWDDVEAGTRWRYLVWSQHEGSTFCSQFVVGEGSPDIEGGLGCTHYTQENDPRDTVFGGGRMFQTGSSDPDEFMFAIGEVGPEVASVRFESESGDAFDVPLVDAPRAADIPYRYFQATLPRFDYARFIAYSADGEELGVQDLCGPGCDQDIIDERNAAVAQYEDGPIEDSARAAVFALQAVGDAGLIDQFSTWFRYSGIAEEDGDFVASFDVFACDPPPYKEGDRFCSEESVPATVRLEPSGEGWAIVQTEGPISPEQRERLISFRDDPGKGLRWLQVAANSAFDPQRKQWIVDYTLVWTGNLPRPVPDYGSLCLLRILDAEGRRVYQARPIPAVVGDEERDRAATITSEIGYDLKRTDTVDISCTEPSYSFYD